MESPASWFLISQAGVLFGSSPVKAPWPLLNQDQFIVMFYTGLKDKNGKEIYEGNIIDWGGLRPLKITFRDCAFRAEGFGSQDVLNLTQEGATAFAEVIGNIYENPELLKE